MDSRTGLPVVGMVGAGQLARMTHQAAIALGQSLRILAADPEDSAALVAPDVHLGSPDDLEALRRFAKGCDVVTFDHEHVPEGHVRELAAAGVVVRPGADALRHAQDKRAMRERLTALGVPVPRWRQVTSPDQVAEFGDEVGWPLVGKAVRGGYDGRGMWTLSAPADAAELLARGPLLVQERAAGRRELAVQLARSPFGQVAVYPVVETVRRDGICREVLAPAPGLAADLAADIHALAIRIATDLDVVGLLAVELFETEAGVLVNELVMRPHHTGHWTLDGARTSQLEQHLRAVLDYPPGEVPPLAPVVVMVNVLGAADPAQSLDERLHHALAAEPGVKVHLYGRKERPGRTVGHVTALGDDLAEVRRRARHAARVLEEGTRDRHR